MIGSVFEKQSELLNTIVEMYLGGEYFEADVTYGSGAMHSVNRPEFCSDLTPQFNYVNKMNLMDTELKNQFRSILFDPPFLCGGGANGIMNKKYTSFKTAGDMFNFLSLAIDNLYSLTLPGGFLIIKCQDLCNGRKQYFTHSEIYNKAVDAGYYARDLLILVNRNLPPPPNVKNQMHVRKHHTFFWIFEKRKRMRNLRIVLNTNQND